MVSYTFSLSFSLPRVVVLLNEIPLFISSIKYFTGDFSIEKRSDRQMQHKTKKKLIAINSKKRINKID
jgi:hypothetical protein